MKKLLIVMLALSVVSLQAGKRSKSKRPVATTTTTTTPTSSSSTPADSSSTPSSTSSYLKSLRSPSVTWQKAVPAAVVVAALLAYMQNYTETVRSTEIDTAA